MVTIYPDFTQCYDNIKIFKIQKLGTCAHDTLYKTLFFQVDIFENRDGTENYNLLTGIDKHYPCNHNHDSSSKMDDFAQWMCHEIHPCASSDNKQILCSRLQNL